jgi:hypothetical protein
MQVDGSNIQQALSAMNVGLLLSLQDKRIDGNKDTRDENKQL